MGLPDCMYEYRYSDDYARVTEHCDNCGNDIHESEEYFDIFGTVICQECILDFKKED